MKYKIKIKDVRTHRDDAAWWQVGTVHGPSGQPIDVGRYVKFDGQTMYDDGQMWSIEHDAAKILGLDYPVVQDWVADDVPGAQDADDAICTMAEALKEAWTEVPCWRVVASLDVDGTTVDLDDDATLGRSRGVEYLSREAAEEAAEELRDNVEEAGLDPNTRYDVEEV